MLLPAHIPIVVASIGAFAAAVTDVWKFKIYNVMTVPMMVSGIVYHATANGPEGFFDSFCGLMFGGAILMLPFLMGGMGAGDLKLLAAIGAWLGMPMTVNVFIASGLASGLCAFVMIAYQQSFSAALVDAHVMWQRLGCFATLPSREDWMQPIVPKNRKRRRVIPYGAMIAFGIVMASIFAPVTHGF